MILFTVHDSASDSFLPPFCMDTVRDAMQGLKTMVNSDQENKYSQFAEDFTLMELGKFDNQSGQIQLHEDPNLIINAAKLKQPKEQ